MIGNVVRLHPRKLFDHDATAMGHALGYVFPVDINADFKGLLDAIDLADLAATPAP